MKFQELAKELKLSLESIQQFIKDFELNVGDCVCSNYDTQPDFEKFARENLAFLKDYEKDIEKEKTIQDIAKKIKQPEDKIKELLAAQMEEPLDTGTFKTTASSFSIDNKLGGNYRFIYDYFGTKTILGHKDFIGYSDLYFFITDLLEPFIDSDETKNWGIHKPAGIILYGPPGSGKIFWAHKIAGIICYELSTVKRHYLGSSYVPGHKFTFNEFLISMMKKGQQAVLVEDFDKILIDDSEEGCGEEESEIKEIILNYIDKFSKENFLMIGASNTLSTLDKEALAPGRFDVLIPVFPPNARERAEIILFSMTKNLVPDSLLLKILEDNAADKVEFWNETAQKMKAYSNTMVIDFTQSLKKQIRGAYKKLKSKKVKITQQMLDNALRDSTAKLTEEYLNQVQQFILDVSINNTQDFPVRLITLQAELNAYKIQEQPERPIGFRANEEQADAG